MFYHRITKYDGAFFHINGKIMVFQRPTIEHKCFTINAHHAGKLIHNTTLYSDIMVLRPLRYQDQLLFRNLKMMEVIQCKGETTFQSC